MNSRVCFAAVVAIGLSISFVVPGELCAAEADSLSTDGWTFEFIPYLWFAGISGTVTIGQKEEGFTADFSDIFASLAVGFMGAFEARSDRWGVIADGLYVRLEQDAPIPVPVGGTAAATITEQVGHVGGLARVADTADTRVDAAAGIRYVNVKTELSATGGLFDGTSRSRTDDWVDGYLGFRGVYRFSSRWSAVGYLDAGAGGSDFSWQALAGLGFELSRTFSARAGYRYLAFKFSKDYVDYDFAMAGFYLGVGIRF